jgi:hypothetical protein
VAQGLRRTRCVHIVAAGNQPRPSQAEDAGIRCRGASG